MLSRGFKVLGFEQNPGPQVTLPTLGAGVWEEVVPVSIACNKRE